MDNSPATKTVLPQADGRALDFIKICAAVFMVLDHIDLMWLDRAEPGLFMLGRATFPLFCYALAVAFLRTGPEKSPRYGLLKYAPRLLLLAAFTEPISLYVRDIDVMNVLFTLGLGAIVAGLSFRMKDWQLIACTLLAVVLMEFGSIVEFGPAGIMLPAAIIMYMTGRRGGLACMILLLLVINLGGYSEAVAAFSPGVAFYVGMTWIGTILLPWWVIKWSQRLPNDGRYLHKYALHVFYPGHLVLLWFVARYMLHIWR